MRLLFWVEVGITIQRIKKVQNKMNCILHIGTEKTGTTAIQDFLYQNRELLKQEGYGVLTSVGMKNNRGLASYAMRDNRSDDYFVAHGIVTLLNKFEHDKLVEEDFKQEIKELNDSCHTILITSEHFHSRCVYPDEINKLKSFLMQYFKKIDVIVYLRPQVDVVTSLYSTFVRAGGIKTFDDFVISNCTKNNPYYNYDELLTKWSNSFGHENLKVRIFDKTHLLNGDIVSDFLSCINIESSSFQSIGKSNESLTPFGQEVLRLNNITNYTFLYKGKPYKQYIYDKVNSLCVGKGCSLSAEKAQSIQNLYHESNTSVAKKWFDKNELFNINFDKYSELSLDISSAKMLKELFIDKNSIEMRIKSGVKNKNLFESIASRLAGSLIESADILREVAFAFEKKGDIETAYKIMYEAYKLRPEGPVIKQKLNEYKNRLYSSQEI